MLATDWMEVENAAPNLSKLDALKIDPKSDSKSETLAPVKRPKIILQGRAALLYLATGIIKEKKQLGFHGKDAVLFNDDFREFLRQMKTSKSLKSGGGNFEFMLPNYSDEAGEWPFKKFRIHLAHPEKNPLPPDTIKIYLRSALEKAGLVADQVDLEF